MRELSTKLYYPSTDRESAHAIINVEKQKYCDMNRITKINKLWCKVTAILWRNLTPLWIKFTEPYCVTFLHKARGSTCCQHVLQSNVTPSVLQCGGCRSIIKFKFLYRKFFVLYLMLSDVN